MLTGDAAVNPGAPIICATAEVLANHALRDRELADIGLVVMDEFHFYTEPDRGWAWQVPLLLMPDTQFLLMSATLGETAFFEEDLTRRTGRETVAISGVERPVPLEFSWVLTAVHETIELLLRDDRGPVYVVSFTQASAVEQAQALTSVELVSSERKAAIKDAVGHFRFGKGFGATLRRLVLHGVGVHHAGMLPKYRRLVETLAQAGLLAVICGTDTLGVGINVPIRTVLLTSLTKYDGRKQRVLRAREFHQIAGRAGRAGFDTVGYVVVQAPEHVVENEKALAKAGDDPKKRRRVVRRKPPEGTLSYTEATYDRLVSAPPEPLTSKMRVDHAMVLNVLDQWEGQQAALHTLLLDNHEEPTRREALVERAVQVLGSLLRARVVEPDDGSALDDWLPPDEPDAVAPPAVDPAASAVADDADGILGDGAGDLGPIGELLAAAGHVTRSTDRVEDDTGDDDAGTAPGVSGSEAVGARALRARRRPAVRRGPVPGGARPARRLRAQPAAVGVRAGCPRAAGRRGARVRARRRQRHRGHPRRPAPGAHGPALRGPRRGGRGDEGRRDGLRGPDGGPRRRDVAAARSRRSSRGPCASTGSGTRGSTRATSRRSRSSGRCTSAR